MVALFLPGVVLILGSGFVFGFWRGLLAVWAGGAVGQALAFLLTRYLFHGWVETTLKQRWKKWAIIDKAIEHDGWKLVLIMRFSPIIPYNLVCACWGVSGGALICLGAQRLLCLWLQCQSSAGCVLSATVEGPHRPGRCHATHSPTRPPACCSSTLRWPPPTSPSGSSQLCRRWASSTSAPSLLTLAGALLRGAAAPWGQARQQEGPGLELQAGQPCTGSCAGTAGVADCLCV